MSMKGPVECIRCHAHMEFGVADNTQAGLTQQNWSPGEPQPSFWTGLKVEKKDQVVPVTTLRCPKCGYLESYAISQSQKGVIVSGRSSSQRQLAAVLIGLVALLIALGVALLIRAK
jgi:hypothetical protein